MENSERCNKCKHYDKERSNNNWHICKACDMDAVVNNDASKCKSFEPLKS